MPISRRPLLVLLFLFSINILNYVDRQVLYAVLPLVKIQLRLSDSQLGFLASAFMFVYMVAAPLVAILSGTSDRVRWIAGGVLAWSGATFFSGLANSFPSLFAARAAVGVGEASFGSISPSFVAEHFSMAQRGRALAFFSMAIPVGSALGYVLGGLCGERFGWQFCFRWAGVVGIPLGLIALRLKDPRSTIDFSSSAETATQTYLSLFRNKSFVYDTLASAALTFTLGGLAVWMPTFLNRNWGLSVSRAGTIFGGITVITGILGSLAGGILSDAALKRTKKAYFLVSAIGLFVALPLAIVTLFITKLSLALFCLAATEFFVFFNMGPLSAAITVVTPLPVRSMAFAVNIFFIHALGDAVSPFLIGLLSDASNLRVALLCSTAFLGLAGFFCLMGTRHYAADAARIGVS